MLHNSGPTTKQIVEWLAQYTGLHTCQESKIKLQIESITSVYVCLCIYLFLCLCLSLSLHIYVIWIYIYISLPIISQCLVPIAYFLWPIASGLLPIVYCLVTIAHYLLCVAIAYSCYRQSPHIKITKCTKPLGLTIAGAPGACARGGSMVWYCPAKLEGGLHTWKQGKSPWAYIYIYMMRTWFWQEAVVSSSKSRHRTPTHSESTG